MPRGVDTVAELGFAKAPRPAPAGAEALYLSDPNDPVLLQPASNSFSGADFRIYAAIRSEDIKPDTPANELFVPLVDIQTLTVSSARSMHPARNFNRVAPTAYTRGGRTIAGSLVFAVSSQDVFARIAAVSRKENRSNEPFFVDNMPPMMVFIEAANEHGWSVHAALVDVEISNFGTTFSVDDMYNEATYSYVARYFYPLVGEPVTFVQDLAGVGKEAVETAGMMVEREIERGAPPILPYIPGLPYTPGLDPGLLSRVVRSVGGVR